LLGLKYRACAGEELSSDGLRNVGKRRKLYLNGLTQRSRHPQGQARREEAPSRFGGGRPGIGLLARQLDDDEAALHVPPEGWPALPLDAKQKHALFKFSRAQDSTLTPTLRKSHISRPICCTVGHKSYDP